MHCVDNHLIGCINEHKLYKEKTRRSRPRYKLLKKWGRMWKREECSTQEVYCHELCSECTSSFVLYECILPFVIF